jgi:hypothetical protein
MASEKLNPADRVRLQADSLCDIRTVKRWWTGKPVRNSTAERLEASAKKLGLRRPKGGAKHKA